MERKSINSSSAKIIAQAAQANKASKNRAAKQTDKKKAPAQKESFGKAQETSYDDTIMQRRFKFARSIAENKKNDEIVIYDPTSGTAITARTPAEAEEIKKEIQERRLENLLVSASPATVASMVESAKNSETVDKEWADSMLKKLGEQKGLSNDDKIYFAQILVSNPTIIREARRAEILEGKREPQGAELQDSEISKKISEQFRQKLELTLNNQYIESPMQVKARAKLAPPEQLKQAETIKINFNDATINEDPGTRDNRGNRSLDAA